MTDTHGYRVVVLELDDVVPRIRADRPNLYVGISTRPAGDLADGLNSGRYRPAWARRHVLAVRADLAPDVTLEHTAAVRQLDTIIRRLRTKGYTVNRNTTAYRTYVINLHNPALADTGAGYVYVGQTSKTPEARLVEHLTGAVSAKGTNLSSRVVRKYGQDLNHDLMTSRIYLTQRQAVKAERRLAERLRRDGYVVEGGH